MDAEIPSDQSFEDLLTARERARPHPELIPYPGRMFVAFIAYPIALVGAVTFLGFMRLLAPSPGVWNLLLLLFLLGGVGSSLALSPVG